MKENILINKYVSMVVVLFLIAFGLRADKLLSIEEKIVTLTLLGEAHDKGEMGMYAVGRKIEKVASERNLRPAWACMITNEFKCWAELKGVRISHKVKEMEAKWLKAEFDKNGTLSPDPRHLYARGLARDIVAGKKLERK